MERVAYEINIKEQADRKKTRVFFLSIFLRSGEEQVNARR